MNAQAEFFVVEIMKDGSGRPVYVGFPDQGRGVRVGDKFILRYEVPRTLDDARNGRPRAEPVNQRSLSLTVTAIDSMSKLIQELPLGVTGALYLEGDGIEHVGRRTFLKTSDSIS